jgi:hypothetical protein
MTVQTLARALRALSLSIAGSVVAAGAMTAACSAARAEDHELFGPAFNRQGELLLPSNYREWVNVTSSLNLSYDSEVDPNAPPPDPNAPPPPSVFQNVFATPAAYQTFRRTGTWPDRTMLIIEIRQAVTNPTVREGALVQGELIGFVADVKDQRRYGGNGWRFFSFRDEQGNAVDQAAPLDQSATCYTCHREHAAVDNTFVQFYPTLFEIAKKRGTIRPDWDPDAKL